MSTGIKLIDYMTDVTMHIFNTDTGTLDEYTLVAARAQPDIAMIQVPKHHQSFIRPHEKQRRGKFKRSGK